MCQRDWVQCYTTRKTPPCSPKCAKYKTLFHLSARSSTTVKRVWGGESEFSLFYATFPERMALPKVTHGEGTSTRWCHAGAAFLRLQPGWLFYNGSYCWVTTFTLHFTLPATVLSSATRASLRRPSQFQGLPKTFLQHHKKTQITGSTAPSITSNILIPIINNIFLGIHLVLQQRIARQRRVRQRLFIHRLLPKRVLRQRCKQQTLLHRAEVTTAAATEGTSGMYILSC